MVEIANYFNFDGYLLNVECDLSENYELIEKLLSWMSLFRDLMHESNPESIVIWYDSVLQDTGELSWQSSLTETNFKFFEVSDAYFTDYHWEREELLETLATYKNHTETLRKSTYDIFIGNDLYGRGTYAGG